MTALTPRPYQASGIDEIREHYRDGIKRVLLHLATGGGKTFIFSMVLKGVHANGKRALMVVKGKELVDQASKRLTREGVPHGVLQGKHWNYRPDLPIQVCSIDTLYSRGLTPPADLIVIDEAHYAVSTSFQWFLAHYPDAFYLPVTATPHVKGGLKHIAEKVVYPISMRELISQGYLAAPRYYAPTSPDVSGVTIDKSTGDYKNGELGCVMSASRILGDMVAAYQRHAGGGAAVCFAVNVEHSKMLARVFSESGVPAAHIDAKTPKDERESIMQRLENGEVKVVCNVGILCVGVDMPYLRAIILARPTTSYNLFIQQVGRGTRRVPGKDTFVVLDHANNLEKHGLIEYEKACDLDGKPRKESEVRPVICGSCFAVYERPPIGDPLVCPYCAFENKPPVKEGGALVDNKADTEIVMAEIVDKEAFMKVRAQRADLDKFCKTAAARGYKQGWVYHKIKDKYGDEFANKSWREIRSTVPQPDAASRRISVGDFNSSEQDWLVQSMAEPNGGSVP